MNEECDITEKGDAVSPCAPNDESELKPIVGVDCPSSGVNLLLGLLPLVMGMIQIPLFSILPLSSCLAQIPLVNILVPWIAWLCVKKKNSASRPAFRSVMNMQISWTIYLIMLYVFSILLVGILWFGVIPVPDAIKDNSTLSMMLVWGVILIPIVGGIVWLVMTILFAIRVKNDVNAKPPLTIRFLK